MICDFAETYGIFNWRALPARRAATLAAGLRPDSRCHMRTEGVKAQLGESLEAMIHDDLTAILYVMSRGKKHGHKPEFIAHDLIYGKKNSNIYKGFRTAEDFEAEWQHLTGGEHK